MIIILKKGAQESDANPIVEQIRSLGLEPLYLPGEEKIVLDAIGDERILAGLQLEAIESVERVIPILKPYKLSSSEFKPSRTVVDVAGVKFGTSEVVLIAGPCAVESESQILESARAVKAAGASMLRGGAYKPRTSPYAFQGLEEEGLRLLQLARKEVGLPVVTELISEHDLEKVAAATDMFQIGARNMQNFRLLKAVGETTIPVLLKRGSAASLADFLMAAEYILSEGNPNVILCERGIKSFFNDTRNTLDLSIVPLLKRETHLPVIVDPSHGTGVRDLISDMSLAAVAAGADGLIIEVHPEPERALSDAFQQLTPEQFTEIVTRVRKVAAAVDRSVR